MTRPEDSVPHIIPSDRNQVKRTQGVIQQWNADTFENAVAFNGLTAFNVPVASGVEALTYQPGDVVLLEGYAPENATGSWMITGRVISPGSGAAEETITWMTTALGQSVAASVFAEQVHAARDDTEITRSSETFGDPDDGKPGPIVDNVEVVSGIIIVFISVEMRSLSSALDANTANRAGFAGVRITGVDNSNEFVPATQLSAHTRMSNASSTDTFSVDLRSTNTRVFTGRIPPGTYDFKMEYRRDADTEVSVVVDDRNLVVIAL